MAFNPLLTPPQSQSPRISNPFLGSPLAPSSSSGSFNPLLGSPAATGSLPGSADLGTSEGLLNLAEQTGGPVAQIAREAVNPSSGLLSGVGDFFLSGLKKTIRALNVPSNIVAGIIDPNTSVGEAIQTGMVPSDVLIGDVHPDSKIGKIAVGVTKFATDVLLNPLTYISFGAGAGIFGIRATSKVAGKVLTDTGEKLLQKGIKLGIDGGLSEDFVKQSFAKMVEQSPELAAKFMDQGGIKVFGRTILSGQRIRFGISSIPGAKAVDMATEPIRKLFGAAFSRDRDLTFGKLPGEFTDLRQRYLDLGTVKQEDAIKTVVSIARANDVTYEQLGIITDAIETGTRPADIKLANTVDKIKRELGIARKGEMRRGLLADRPRIIQSSIRELGKTIEELRVQKTETIVTDELEKALSKMVDARRSFLQSSVRTIADVPGIGARTARDLSDIGVNSFDDLLDQSKTGLFEHDVFDPTAKIRKILGKSTDNIVRAAEDAAKDNRRIAELIPDRLAVGSRADVIKKLETSLAALQREKAAATTELARTEKIFNNYAPHMLVDTPTAEIPFKPGVTKTALASSKRRDIEGTVKSINEEFGRDFFDENIVRTAAVRLAASARATTAYDFFRDVAAKYGASIVKGPSGNVIPPGYIESSIKELKGFAFHPAIEGAMKGFRGALAGDPASLELLKHFDKLQQYWKASVTSIFPAFHGRNAISNVFLNYLDIGLNAVNPARHAMATDLLIKNKRAEALTELAYGVGDKAVNAKLELSRLMSTPVLKDRFGTSWTFGELRSVIRNNHVAFGDEFSGFMDIAERSEEAVGRIGPLSPVERARATAEKVLPISTKFAGFELGRKVSNAIEQQARLVNFISNLRKTGDPLLSAQRVKQFLFDYQNLSQFEKRFMRRIIPFYTFTRKNLELQAHSLSTVPGRVSAEVRAIQTIGSVISGGQKLTQDEESILPDWMRKGIVTLAGRQGQRLNIISGFQTPIEQAFGIFTPPREFVNQLTPLVDIPLAQLTGYDLFSGKPLSETTNAEAFRFAPKSIKNFIGYTEVPWHSKDGTKGGTFYVALRPERFHLLLNLPPTSRVISTIRQVTDQDVSGGLRTVQQLTGVRAYDVDLDRQQAQHERQLRQKLEEILDKAGVIYRFQRTALEKK